jgi:hypothetical protein
MDHELLVSDMIEAGSKFLLEFNRYKPVDVAFWGRSSENGQWRLYVASDQFLDTSIREDYRQVHRIIGARSGIS